MYSVITVLIVVVCIFLILFVLVQNSKGGGLAANFSSANQIMGVRKTADFLEKWTWGLASALVILCVVGAIWLTSGESNDSSIITDKAQNAVDPKSVPSFPLTSQPEEQQSTPTEQQSTPATTPSEQPEK